MRPSETTEPLRRLLAADLYLSHLIHDSVRSPLLGLFRLCSRLGDGWVWLSMAVLLPQLYGARATPVIGQLLVVAAACLVVYKPLKKGTARPRPCEVSESLDDGVPVLDCYSFPSGHTLHAVAFSVTILASFPGLAWCLVPFTVLVALSRVVLGLHYPTDVVAGAALGAAVGGVVLSF